MIRMWKTGVADVMFEGRSATLRRWTVAEAEDACGCVSLNGTEQSVDVKKDASLEVVYLNGRDTTAGGGSYGVNCIVTVAAGGRIKRIAASGGIIYNYGRIDEITNSGTCKTALYNFGSVGKRGPSVVSMKHEVKR